MLRVACQTLHARRILVTLCVDPQPRQTATSYKTLYVSAEKIHKCIRSHQTNLSTQQIYSTHWESLRMSHDSSHSQTGIDYHSCSVWKPLKSLAVPLTLIWLWLWCAHNWTTRSLWATIMCVCEFVTWLCMRVVFIVVYNNRELKTKWKYMPLRFVYCRWLEFCIPFGFIWFTCGRVSPKYPLSLHLYHNTFEIVSLNRARKFNRCLILIFFCHSFVLLIRKHPLLRCIIITKVQQKKKKSSETLNETRLDHIGSPH